MAERCPTCGSDNPKRAYCCINNKCGICPDPWQGVASEPAPTQPGDADYRAFAREMVAYDGEPSLDLDKDQIKRKAAPAVERPTVIERWKHDPANPSYLVCVPDGDWVRWKAVAELESELSSLRGENAQLKAEHDLYALLRGICEDVIDWLGTLSYDAVENPYDHPLTKQIRAKLQQMYEHPLDNKVLIGTDQLEARLERVEELKAALQTYGRHKDTWKCMTGERACASISGGKCDCGFEQTMGTEEGNRG